MTPLPAGFAVILDRSVRAYGNVLVGGDPIRMMRLTITGRAALERLMAGAGDAAAPRELARRLVDAGMAHPKPPPSTEMPDVTVVIPVRDRADPLARCLAAVGPDLRTIVVDDGSRDACAVARVAARHGAAVIRHVRPQGPGAARNTALAYVDTELVAFLDSDCIPGPGWLVWLAPHFPDPLVGACAPRVRPGALPRDASFRERFAAARSPMDLGEAASAVVPGSRVSYVPTAALVVRRSALGRAFDPALRYGEDVNLVWRLHDAGWRIRYDPTVTVEHSEPRSWRRLLDRRMGYGTAAAPLAKRHRGRLAPLVARPAPMATALLLLARRPGPAAAAFAFQTILLAKHTRRLGLPRGISVRWSAQTAGWTLIGIGHAATIVAAPALIVALLSPRSRASACALLVMSPLQEWLRRRPAVDPVRWTLACLADDAAYGLGVWWGCLTHRTLAPVLPRLSRESSRPSRGPDPATSSSARACSEAGW